MKYVKLIFRLPLWCTFALARTDRKNKWNSDEIDYHIW